MPAAIPIMIGLMAGGTALDVFGKVKAGNAAKRAGKEAQDLEEFNARVAEDQAEDAIRRGVDEEQQLRGLIRQTIGAQKAGFAAGNIDVGSGSAVDVQADAAYLGELDALTIRENAAREAKGYRADAERARRRGKYAAMTGRMDQTASRFQAAGSILGSAAQGAGLLAQRYGRR